MQIVLGQRFGLAHEGDVGEAAPQQAEQGRLYARDDVRSPRRQHRGVADELYGVAEASLIMQKDRLSGWIIAEPGGRGHAVRRHARRDPAPLELGKTARVISGHQQAHRAVATDLRVVGREARGGVVREQGLGHALHFVQRHAEIGP